MKKISLKLILLIFCIVIFNSSNAQVKLTDESIVKDSTGMVYPPIVWKKLMQSGDYILKPALATDGNYSFVITKLSEADKDKMAATAPKPKESKYFTTGKSITPFKDRDIDGKKINLKQLKGQIVVLNFWFVGCPPCKMEMPELNRLVEEYKKDSVVFIGICLDDEASIRELMKTNPFNYQIIDRAKTIAELYGINTYPTNVILDKEGIVQFHSTGFNRGIRLWMKKVIDAIKSNTQVPKL